MQVSNILKEVSSIPQECCNEIHKVIIPLTLDPL